MDTKISVGVVGVGTMGKGIVQLLAQSDNISSVIWKGRTVEGTQLALSGLKSRWDRLIVNERFDSASVSAFIDKISITHSYEDLSNAACIIEAVSEDMTAKKEVFDNLAKITNPDIIFASNTSSLSITEIACLTRNPANVVGLHFFNPAPVMVLTEVIKGLMTSQTTIDWAMNFSRSLGKEPVLVTESPGFIVNRMLIPMINEAIGILAEGVASAEEIDKAMCLGANHPIGPLALADLIGNDVNLSIMETLHIETGDPKYRAHPLLRKMVRANRLGRKTGSGFFEYI